MERVLKCINSPEETERVLSEYEQAGTVDQVINAKDEHGDTIVHFAARLHSLPVLKILWSYGCDFEAVNEHGRQPLHEAIGSAECVEYLVNHCKVNVNALKRGDWTPMMVAALKGRLDIIQILEKAGGRIDLVNKDGRTALHLACQQGHVEVSEYLAQQCPGSIMKPTRSGRLPAQISAALCDDLEAGFRITTFILQNARVPMSDMLRHRDKSGRNLLQDAVVSRNLQLLQFLLEHGADPNETDSLGRSIVHHAAMLGYLDILRLLLQQTQHRISWDTPDSWDRWTPLMHAARHGHPDIVKFLVEEVKAGTNQRDKHSRSAADIACTWKQDKVSEYLSSIAS